MTAYSPLPETCQPVMNPLSEGAGKWLTQNRQALWLAELAEPLKGQISVLLIHLGCLDASLDQEEAQGKLPWLAHWWLPGTVARGQAG